MWVTRTCRVAAAAHVVQLGGFLSCHCSSGTQAAHTASAWALQHPLLVTSGVFGIHNDCPLTFLRSHFGALCAARTDSKLLAASFAANDYENLHYKYSLVQHPTSTRTFTEGAPQDDPS